MNTKALLILMSSIGITLNAYTQTNSPNIIWISCEDIGPVLSCYGATGIKTPNIDKLAQEGVRYANAYATAGVCAPSRFSIITGMYPARAGAHNMRTGDFFKFRGPEDDRYKSYVSVKDITGRNVPEYGVVLPVGVRCFTEYLRAAGYYCVNDYKCDYQFNAPLSAWNNAEQGATYNDREAGQPFFYVKNYMITHESRIWEKEDDSLLVDPKAIEVPAYYPDIPVVRQAIARKYSNIVELDREVGLLLEKLESESLLDNTIIFFWSDHGGNLLRQKRDVGNAGLHVPLIVRYPDKRMAGQVNERIVSLMDLGPTVLSLANIEPPEYMDGKAFLGAYEAAPRKYIFGSADRFDETVDMRRSVIDGRFVYVRNFRPELPYLIRNRYREQIEMNKVLIEKGLNGEVGGDAAYIYMQTKPIEELFDLTTDPHEVHNIAGDPAYQEKLIELRSQLGSWQLAIGDKGFFPEHDLVHMFWPNMQQPKMANVSFIPGKQGLMLKSVTEGASIVYQTEEDLQKEQWQLYTHPIPLTIPFLRARAERIGYKTSDITSYNKSY